MAMFQMCAVGPFRFSNVVGKFWTCQRNLSKSRMITVLMGLPNKPKQPLNPFVQFVQTCRSEFMAQNPNISSKELLKLMGRQWSQFSPEEKKKYVNEFEQQRIAYKAKKEVFENSLSDKQKEELKLLTKESHSGKTQQAISKLKKTEQVALKKPKPPLSAFCRFVTERGLSSGKNVTSTMKEYAEEWRNMPSNKKEKYKLDYEKEYEQYKKVLIAWEKKMMDEGNFKQVRLKTLKETAPGFLK